MSRLSVRLLGSFRATIDGEPVTGYRSDKVRALLAYLAAEPDTPHRRERLGGLLWPDCSERSARAHLRVALSNLRQVIGDHEATPPYLLISRQTVQFNEASDAWADVQSFQSLLETGLPTIDAMEQMVGLYEGEFMAGFSLADSPLFEEWALLTREQLHRTVMEALHRLARSLEERGEYRRALVYAWRQVDLDPWREVAHRQVMRLLARSGERSAAIAQYRRCCQVLQDELGVEVSKRTRQLYERLERGEGVPGGPQPAVQHHLPAQTTSFEGREKEQAEINQLLSQASCRLLTLVGPGGIGKTRLALEIAAQQASSYPDGVHLAPLAHVSGTAFLASSVAEALRFRLDTTNLDARTQLLDYLRGRTALLVMDSFEHLLTGADLLVDILEHAPQVKLLVTSRERLHLRGEWAYEVQGLAYPGEQDGHALETYGAVKLFVARARQADAGFCLSAEVRPHVRDICRLVQGMPLAIELAAAWVPVLPCQGIASEIEKGLDILAAPERRLPDRHRSLRVAFDYSWTLLTDEAKAAFPRLAVFRGGFSRGAAQAVAGVGLVLLAELVGKSLLRRNAQGRYEMHELLRQYAAERLDAQPAERRQVRQRHSRYYLAFVSAREADLVGDRLPEIKDQIRVEMENVRAAADWAVTHWPAEEAREVLAHLDAFWVVLGWTEGRDTFAAIARTLREAHGTEKAAVGPDTAPLPSALVYQALYSSLLGESDASEAILEACTPALDATGAQRERAVARFARGVSALYLGDFRRSEELFRECISLARAIQDDRWAAHGLMWLGWVHCEVGDYASAQARYEESYALYQAHGNRWGVAFLLTKLGLVADAQDDHVQARRYNEEALQIVVRFGDRAGEAYATSRLSLTAYSQGEYAEALALGRRGQRLFEELGHRWGIAASLCRIGFAALGLGRSEEAETCFQEALQMATSMAHVPLILYAVLGMASLLSQQGNAEQAVELLAFAEAHPQTPPTYLDIAEQWFEGIETRLSPDALRAARERGETRGLPAIVEAVKRDRLAAALVSGLPGAGGEGVVGLFG